MTIAWVCEISALDPSDNAVTLRFADGALTDTAYYYEPRMKSAAVVYVSPSDGGVFKIFSSPNIGEIELINNDGELDIYPDYAVDGRSCKLRLFNDGTFTDYFIGTIDRLSERGNSLFLRMKSLTDALQNTHKFSKYGGTNTLPDGVDGVATDIKGNVKPKVFGRVKQGAPVFVNTSKGIYQVSDRSTCVIDAVYEAGSAVTKTAGADYASLADMLATAPAAGYWKAFQGYFRLGSSAVRTITFDAHDSNVLAGDVFESIVVEAGYTMDATSKAALNAVGEVGIYANSEVSTAQMLDRIIKSCGAYWYFKNAVVYASLLSLAAVSTMTLYDWSITKIERKSVGGGSNGVPVTKIKMQADKIENPQTDLAGAVSAADRARFAEMYRSTEYENTATLTRHPMAETIKIEDGCLRSISDGLTVCTRLLNIFKGRLDIVQVSAAFKEVPTMPDLGAGITIQTTRLGYDTGKLFTLVGYSLDVRRKTVIMDLIG